MDLSLLELELELLTLETEEKSPFERLPEESLLKIFSLLDDKDLSAIKKTCWRFRTVWLENSRLFKKKLIWLNLETRKDSDGEDTLELYQIYTSNPVRFLCTSKEIQVLDKTRTILYSMPATLEIGFNYMFDFFLRRCDIEQFSIKDEVRQLSEEEMNWILNIFEASKASSNANTRYRMVIDSQYLDLIKQTKAKEVYFERAQSSVEVSSLDAKYLYKVKCPEISSHLPVSIPHIFSLIKQWKRGTRTIKDLFFHLAEDQFTWLYFYALFPITWKPETPPLKFLTINKDKLQIGREMDEQELEVIYELDSVTSKGTLSFTIAKKAKMWCDM